MTTAEKKITDSRHIPDGYRFVHGITQDPTQGYCKEIDTPSGTRFIIMLFIGRAIKPTCHYSFKTDELRSTFVNQKIATYLSRKNQTKERRAKRSAPHTLKVDDILYSDWGYDQTNIDFYQVTKIVGSRMVEITPIRSTVIGTSGTYDEVMPIKDSFYGEGSYRGKTMKKIVNADYNSVSINTYSSAYPWNGKPKMATNPMFGR